MRVTNDQQALLQIFFISKKMFGYYTKFSHSKTIAKHYRNYLFIAGKNDSQRLTNIDLYKIDGVILIEN